MFSDLEFWQHCGFSVLDLLRRPSSVSFLDRSLPGQASRPRFFETHTYFRSASVAQPSSLLDPKKLEFFAQQFACHRVYYTGAELVGPALQIGVHREQR